MLPMLQVLGVSGKRLYSAGWPLQINAGLYELFLRYSSLQVH